VAEDGVSKLDGAVVSHNRFEAGLVVYNEEGLSKLEIYNARIGKRRTALFLSSLSKVKPDRVICQLDYHPISL
jgi:hypothetical protein